MNLISYRDEERRLHEIPSESYNGVEIAAINAGREMLRVREVRVDGRPSWMPRFVVPPGGRNVVHRGSFLRTPQGPYPSWSEKKLAASTPTGWFGPYPIAWPGDVQGNAPGGAGIAPYWMSWRRTYQGIDRALRELIGVANRMPIAFDRDVEVDRFALQPGFDTPIGYTYDMEDALRWDPDAQEYLQFQKIDGQHLARATRAALALADLHPFADRFAYMLLRYVKLSWARRDIGGRPANTRLWTAEQILDAETTQEEMRTFCNRELAHVARLVWELEPDGELATDIEDMILRAGIPWHLNPVGCPESRVGSEHGIFEKDEPLSHTFELLLMQDAMRSRPRLEGAVREMHEFLGDKPGWTVNGEGQQFSPPGSSGPDEYALFRGDFESAGYAGPEELIQVAGSRSVDDNPLDSCPSRFWEEAV